MPLTGLLMILLLSCGKADHRSEATPVNETEQQWKMFADITPDDVDERDMSQIADLLPTMYYTPREDGVNCKGRYGKRRFNGNERTKLISPQGKVLATVCSRFAYTLLMEGSAILRDRGDGEKAVNYGGKIKGSARYYYLDRCKYGEGIRRDLCLLPYHTIAADNKVHKVNEIIFVPAAKGIKLPDGSIHDGFFIVRDTGGAFNGIGSQRVDMFTGTDPDFQNAFQKAGFHHKRPLDAFKIKGDSAEVVRQKLREKFGDLY
jgi:3D (Asp-Asp-Asp) domain-containing protein